MSFLKIIKKNNFLPVYLFIIIFFDVYLQFIPLTKIFSFEYSFVNAIVLCLLSGIFFISSYRKSEENYSSFNFKKKILLANLSFLLLPLIISVINSFFTISCPLSDGLSFYFVITFPSLIVGVSLGIISVKLFRHFSILSFILLFIAILIIPLFEFYFNPQIYFYNPIFGFYPGTIYDENLSVNLNLVIYRLFNILYFGAIFLLLYKKNIFPNRFIKKIFFVVILLVAISFNYFSSAWGYSTSFSKLNKELSNKIETQHFVIHFPAQINPSFMRAVCLAHEYYYSRLSKFFGFTMSAKINSYIFGNNEQKKDLIGTANADIAKPWLNCSFITLNDYGETLKHELAHCFSSKMGTGIFKAASGLNPALIEGIAVSADPFYDEHSIDFMAALAYDQGYRINIKTLFSGYSFYSNASSVSYIYAGSFAKFLIDKYGIKKFQKYYSSGSFESSYGVSFDSTEKEFYKSIDTLHYAFNINEADYYYGYKSIFYKICPRYAASQSAKAWRFFAKSNYHLADKIFIKIIKLTGNYSSLIGHSECLVKQNKISDAVNILKNKVNDFQRTSYYFSIELKLADDYFIAGDAAKADSIYKSMTKQYPSERLFCLAKMRLELSPDRNNLMKYLDGSDHDRFMLLKKVNENKYNYYSIPVLIELAKYFNADYKNMLKIFSKPVEADNFTGVYAAYKISNYMFENLDFQNALKLADLAVENNRNKDYHDILQENYDKINWCNSNSSYIFANVKR